MDVAAATALKDACQQAGDIIADAVELDDWVSLLGRLCTVYDRQLYPAAKSCGFPRPPLEVKIRPPGPQGGIETWVSHYNYVDIPRPGSLQLQYLPIVASFKVAMADESRVALWKAVQATLRNWDRELRRLIASQSEAPPTVADPEPGSDGRTTDQPAAAASGGSSKLEWLARAMLTVREHPDWSDSAIAKEVGKSPSTLSRSNEYQAAAAIARNGIDSRPAGYRTAGGGIDAVASDAD